MDQQNSGLGICTECGQHPGIIRKVKKYFCPECWIHQCNLKFRKRLFELGLVVKYSSNRPSPNISHASRSTSSEHILIYYDCSPWAKSLLSLVRDTILVNLEASLENNSIFPFVFTILFIHEGVNENGIPDSTRNPGSGTIKDFEEIRSWLSESESKFGLDFPLLVSSLEKSLSSSEGSKWRTIQKTDISVYLPFDEHLNSQLLMIVDSLKSSSSRIDFLQCLRQNLLISIAQHLKLSKVLLPDQQTTMSVKMFSMMSLGRGEQLAQQMSLLTKVDGVDMTRPLMDLSSDDLLDYLSSLDRTRTMSTMTRPRVSENKGRRIDNIRSQCEDFILTLQKDYPGTVPTLTKIGAKLDPNFSSSSSAQVFKCRLCKQRVDQGGMEAIEFCYGCSNILKEMKDASLLLGLLLS